MTRLEFMIYTVVIAAIYLGLVGTVVWIGCVDQFTVPIAVVMGAYLVYTQIRLWRRHVQATPMKLDPR